MDHISEVLEGTSTFQRFCFTCNKTQGKLRKCGTCQAVYYCDVECQKKNWKEHKRVCNNENYIRHLHGLFHTILENGGVYCHSALAFNKYNITDLKLFVENGDNIAIETTKIMNVLKNRSPSGDLRLIKLLPPSLAIQCVTEIISYTKKVEKMGLILISSMNNVDGWKNDVLEFDIRVYLPKMIKLNYIKVGNSIVWVKNGQLLVSTDEEKLIKLNEMYIDSLKVIFDYLNSLKSVESVVIDTVIHENESLCIYHSIYNEDTDKHIIKGDIFFAYETNQF